MTCERFNNGIVCFPSTFEIVDAVGKKWSFSWHSFLGPTVLKKNGDPMAKQPGEKSAFWPALAAWQKARRA